MVNRFCECLECDTIYEAISAKTFVRDENLYTYCSRQCEEFADRRASDLEARFKSLDEDERKRIFELPAQTETSITGTKSINDVMKDFINAQNNLSESK